MAKVRFFNNKINEYIAYTIVWSKVLYHNSVQNHVSNSHNKTLKSSWFLNQTKIRPAKYIQDSKIKIQHRVKSGESAFQVIQNWQASTATSTDTSSSSEAQNTLHRNQDEFLPKEKSLAKKCAVIAFLEPINKKKWNLQRYQPLMMITRFLLIVLCWWWWE